MQRSAPVAYPIGPVLRASPEYYAYSKSRTPEEARPGGSLLGFYCSYVPEVTSLVAKHAGKPMILDSLLQLPLAPTLYGFGYKE